MAGGARETAGSSGARWGGLAAALDVASVLAFLAALGAALSALGRLAGGTSLAAGAGLTVLGVVLGWLLADAFSGLVHYVADNYGDAEWPFIGPYLLRPFREHHEHPEGILGHGFFERSGNTALLGAVPLLLSVGLSQWLGAAAPHARHLALGAGSALASLGVSVMLTNEIHALAHARAPGRLARALQRLGVILDPEAHARHHRPPYATHYCITSGLWDRLLSRGSRPRSALRPPSLDR
jgi:ubiquitin-conjugating enzyme E2 variant